MILPRYAVLDESGNVVPAALLEWARYLEYSRQRVIQQDEVGGYFISTVFVGINMQYDLSGPPLWFETMVFHPRRKKIFGKMRRQEAGFERRYTTLAEAEAGHMEAVNWVRVNKLSRQGYAKPET